MAKMTDEQVLTALEKKIDIRGITVTVRPFKIRYILPAFVEYRKSGEKMLSDGALEEILLDILHKCCDLTEAGCQMLTGGEELLILTTALELDPKLTEGFQKLAEIFLPLVAAIPV